MKRVPEPHRLRNMLIIFSAVVCLAVVTTKMIKIPETVSGSCLLNPARRWDLKEMRPGSYKAGTNDMLTGELRHYRVYQFDRPSFVDLSLAVSNGGDSSPMVSAGELLASANSTSLAIELAEKKGDLANAVSELEVLESGSKPAVMKRADLAIKLAKTELVAYQLKYARDKGLFDEEILSAEDWDVSKARLDLLKVDVEIAEAEKAELASGASVEKIEKAQTRITSLQSELVALQAMIDALEIRTPISGRLSLHEGSGPLLRVSASDTMIARILIPQRQAQKPLVGQPVKMVVPGMSGESFTGEVLRINQDVTLTDGGPYVTVFALLENDEGRLATGMMGRAHIYGETTSLLHQLKEEFTTVIRQEIWPR